MWGGGGGGGGGGGAMPPTHPRCCHQYMFLAILGSFDNKTIVLHTHIISGWGLPGIPMDN